MLISGLGVQYPLKRISITNHAVATYKTALQIYTSQVVHNIYNIVG